MNVLVVGGAGYIGSTLSRMLWQRGHEVTVFDRMLFGGEGLTPLLSQPRFRLVAGDIRDDKALAEIMPGHDAVVLLAAIVGEPACNRDVDTAVETNRDGTLNVLRRSVEAKIPRFVFSSTCSNYGVTNHDALVDEEAPLQPISTYAQTKVEAEKAILAEANSEFCPTVLRFSTAFGVSARMRFDLLVSDFSLHAVRDRKIVIYGEQFWRPFVHVDDISEATIQTLGASPDVVSGAVFNVGSNSANTRKIDLGEAVQKQVPGTELEFVERNEDPRSYRVEFSRIEERLGFKARWSIDDGIREVASALQANVWTDPAEARFYN